MHDDFDLNRRRFLRTAGAGMAAALPWLDPKAAIAADGTLTVGLPNNPPTFDPINQTNHDAMAVAQVIYENLIEVNVDGEIKPMLAVELPRASADGLTWWFDLRDDVRFQNGEKFTAEDVKYSFDYVLDPKNKAVRRPVWEPIRNIVVESPIRVRFEMSHPYGPWLLYMTKYMGIFPKGSREKHDAAFFRSNPVGLGTGPGIFVEARQNDYVKLKRNPNYWRKGVPAWSELIFRVVPEDAVRVAYLMANEVQIISAPPPRDFVRLRKLPGIQGGSKPALGSRCFMSTNNAKPPFDDVHFRKAVSRALDRKKIADLFYGQLDPSAIPAPSSSWWFNQEANALLDYNLDAAKKELSESKYPNGAAFDLRIPAESYLVDVKDAALVVQANLSKLGIKANLQVLETSQLIREMLNGNHVASLVVFMMPSDSIYWIRQAYYPGGTMAKAAGYKSEAVINAIDEAYRANTQDALKPIMRRIVMILAEDCPNIWIGTVHAANLWRTEVKGFEVNTGLTMRLRDVVPG